MSLPSLKIQSCSGRTPSNPPQKILVSQFTNRESVSSAAIFSSVPSHHLSPQISRTLRSLARVCLMCSDKFFGPPSVPRAPFSSLHNPRQDFLSASSAAVSTLRCDSLETESCLWSILPPVRRAILKTYNPCATHIADSCISSVASFNSNPFYLYARGPPRPKIL
jgi:hypothetical protein